MLHIFYHNISIFWIQFYSKLATNIYSYATKAAVILISYNIMTLSS